MKIQERTGAGAGRSAVPAGPSVGDRLPTPPRERKPALAALAVLLILVGALGATMLVLQAGDRIEVVKITEEIPARPLTPRTLMPERFGNGSASRTNSVRSSSGSSTICRDRGLVAATYRGRLSAAPPICTTASG